MLKQTLPHLLRVCAFLVDLVNRNDHRHISRLGMLDRFNRLRHQAIIGRNDQDNDVRNRRTALAHLGKGLMARSIKKSDDRAILCLHLIRTDMLRDAAGFTRDDICTA